MKANYIYLEKQVQCKGDGSNGGGVKIDIKALIHIQGLTITKVGVRDLVANILANAKSSISKGS